MSHCKKQKVRESGKLWDSLIARSEVYSEAANKVVELATYNKHTEQEMCALLKRLGGELKLTKKELDDAAESSFTVLINEDDFGNVISKEIKLK